MYHVCMHIIISSLTFQSDVLALVDAFEQLRNSFTEDNRYLFDLDQSIVMADG